MLLNYLKLSFRLLARNPFFTFINIAGLSVGFATFFILWPFTQSQLGSDQFISDYKNIERVVLDFRWTDNGGESWGHLNIPSSTAFTANELKNDPSIKGATRFIPQRWFDSEGTPNLNADLIVSLEKNGQVLSRHRVDKSTCADRNFFQFFGFHMKYGDSENALEDVNGVALSESISLALFGDRNPLGEQLKFNEELFVVSAVFQDIPGNSHMDFDYIFSNESKLSAWNTYSEYWVPQYFKLVEGGRPLADILNESKEKLIGPFLQKNPHIKIDFTTQPLEEIAFSQGYSGDFVTAKSKFLLIALTLVSVVVLIMAWLNYVNLTISRTRTRFKEIAARKVTGAMLPDLLLQFICQSAVINVLAALIGMTLVQMARQPFDQLLNIQVIPLSDTEWETFTFFIAFISLGIVATSVYPAWITMNYTTRQLLNQKIPTQKRFTTTLFTTAQYTTALSLITWIFVMNEQLSFVLNKELGLERDNVVVIDGPVIGLEKNGLHKINQFASLVKSKTGDDRLSLSARVCGEQPLSLELRRVGSDVFYGIDSHGGVDENFIPLYGLKLIAGRNFERDEKKKSIIISRFTAKRLGFRSPDDAVGSLIEANLGASPIDGDLREPTEIIGVIEDYRVTPLLMEEGSTESITGRGQCLTYLTSVAHAIPQRISLKVEGENALDLIAEIEHLFKQQFPDNLFNWYFLDDNVNRQYGDQQVARNQLTFFTILAVAVACLGLLGMISNKVAEKFKEISMRRILGARHHHVLSLLLRSTIVQLGTALIIGVPIAWKFSNQYLEKYTDRIEMQWWHFAIPVLILTVIMFLTIASVLWKAARSNPVDALKYE